MNKKIVNYLLILIGFIVLAWGLSHVRGVNVRADVLQTRAEQRISGGDSLFPPPKGGDRTQ